ncbi:GGDEF and EAL domain-containing protein [Blastococcus sp. CT_GayMR19]|uniref:putative bifunctional diguanylate cyclase/phosphodiesterase n=1 Tax=Blastococcus sp. CT_GayMR19 TaxID=2559608 RepID=UPI001072FDA1|nr:GGDEF and EAL domain-containing protein [Blastococcus sp. CT_GayMR19]TFV78206.1 GGDEF and EAL domain-containing protein [Blastococcus sp. CT_GayMR19]
MTTTMTDGGAAAPRRFSLGVPQKIALLTGGIAATAVTLFVIVVAPLPAAPTALNLPWVLWAVAFAASEVLIVHVQWKRESHTFSLSDLVLAAGLALALPWHLVLAQLAGTTLILVFYRRQRGLKLAFNTVQFALSATMAVLTFSAVSSVLGQQWAFAGQLLAIAVATMTASAAIFAVMTLSTGHADMQPLIGMLGFSLPFTVGAGAVGVVIARTSADDPAALVLLMIPTLLIIAAYRAYTRAREQQENLKLLHEVTSLLHGGDVEAALGDFLSSARTAFHAEVAELVLVSSAGTGGMTVSRSQEGDDPVVMSPAVDDLERQRLLRLATTQGSLITRAGGGRGGLLDGYAAERGVKDAMVAALRTEDRVHGVLLVAGRMGAGTTFNGSDLALLETFGRHVATSLERGRLEETLRQVTDLKEQLRHQTLHDALTGLPNRTLFLDRARQAVEVAARTHAWPAVLYLDLDGFKPVNDEYGHDVGDAVLRTIAIRLRGCLRPADTAARLGGDEFAVLLGGPLDQQGITRVVDRIQAQFDVPVDLGNGHVAKIGASIGIAVGSFDTENADKLIRQSDIAMYSAKRSGGGASYYEPGMGDPTSAREEQIATLNRAIREGELFTVYQPLINLRTGRPTGAEALVRWQHPDDGVVGPDAFIGLAEETGLIVEIGTQVLREACRQAARWAEADPSQPLTITVNLSARQLSDPAIVGTVTEALADAGLDAKRLVLEITETVLMQDREAAAATLWQLKALGIRIAIDDFGTGYSSLAYLRRFPIDMLKIAREFVDGLGRDEHDDVITRAIVELASTLGLLTVAEGIETHDQQTIVTALGCDLGQGYLFSVPVDAEAAFAVLTATPLAVPQPRPGEGPRLYSVG